MSSERLLPLDGLRALAVLAVILLHVGIWHGGGIGVDLFFVLSGFLITGILFDSKAAASTWIAYAQPFYARRALRIFPVAFAAMGLAFVVAPALSLWPGTPIREQAWFWAYVSNWHQRSGLYVPAHLQHFWSLSVEEQFYATWPLIVWLLSVRQLKRACAIVVLVVSALRISIATWHFPASTTMAVVAPTVLRFDGLAAGAWLAIAAREPGGLTRCRPLAWCAVPTGLAILRLTGDVSGAVVIFAASVIVALTVDPSHLFAKILSLPALCWIGRVSYVVYVVHFPIAARLLGRGVSPLANLGATVAVSLAIAWLSGRYFEQPILALRSRWPMPVNRCNA